MRDLIAIFAAFLLGLVTANFFVSQTDRIMVINTAPLDVSCEGVAVGETRSRPCPMGEIWHMIDQCVRIAEDRAGWKQIKSTCAKTDG